MKYFIKAILYSSSTVFLLAAFANAHAELTDLIPADNNTFYYKMGGGQSIPVPANSGAVSVPLSVGADLGTNFNCGVFNPKASITNSLNEIQNSFQNIEQSVVSNATSAITEFPLYMVSRADPSLYNLLNNGLLEARKDFELSTKSCQAMQSEIAQGKNPYQDWASASLGNDWKYSMSLAGDSNNNNKKMLAAFGSSDTGVDINQVNAQVSQDNGNNGVPWVHGSNTGRGDLYAGGQGQPPIQVLHDTAIAGYNVVLQSGRAYDDTSAPSKNNNNAHLVETWATPVAAANWLTNVLGDQVITTYDGGNKQSTPGVGLLPVHQQLATQITQQLQNLVSGQTPISVSSLQSVSAPGVMINSAVITAIRQYDPVTQSILINKLGQESAAAQVIDQALLARELLQEGSQVPAIYSNHAAQIAIQNAAAQLKSDIDDLLFSVKVRKALISNTAAELLTATQNQQINQSAMQPNAAPAPILQSGAIKKQQSDDIGD